MDGERWQLFCDCDVLVSSTLLQLTAFDVPYPLMRIRTMTFEHLASVHGGH